MTAWHSDSGIRYARRHCKRNATKRARSAVVCFDEWGPLELRPQGAQAWAKRTPPRRRRTTHTRSNGVEYFAGCYDVHADCFAGQSVKRRHAVKLFAAFRRLRRCFPRTRLYVVCDNLPWVRGQPRFPHALRRLRSGPVFASTGASWCNAIERLFNNAKRIALTGTDDRAHPAHRWRIVAHIRYHHQACATGRSLARMLSSRNVKLESQ